MAFEYIIAELEPPVGVVTLNRPKVLNALSPELIGEVTAALAEMGRDETVRAVVLTGGPKVFAAGADIGDMAERGPVDQLQRDHTGRWAAIAAFTKPLIAAVNGYALGGGCELALLCDLVAYPVDRFSHLVRSVSRHILTAGRAEYLASRPPRAAGQTLHLLEHIIGD